MSAGINGLSVGAKAGIAVAVSFVGLLMIAVVVVLLGGGHRKKMRRKEVITPFSSTIWECTLRPIAYCMRATLITSGAKILHRGRGFYLLPFFGRAKGVLHLQKSIELDGEPYEALTDLSEVRSADLVDVTGNVYH